MPSEWIDIYDGNGVPLGIYVRLTTDDWELVPNTVNSVSFRVEVEGPYDKKNYFSFGHASSASAVYEPTNSVTTVDGLEVKYRASIWGSTALVTDRQSVTLNIGGQSQRYCGIPRTVNGLEVNGITSSTFSMKDEITALQLPFQVTSANAGTLGDFSHLQSISVVDDCGKVVQELICVDGAFYSIDKTTLYFVTAAATALTIPATVTEIVANAFQNAANLTSVTIDPANPSFKVVNDMICTFDETKIISALPYMTELRFPEAAIEVDWASAEWRVFVDDKGRAKFSGQPYEIVAGVKYTFTCGDGGATILFAEPLSSIPAVLRIPDKLLGLPVKGIGESAFTQGYGFEDACTSIAIPEGVEKIGRSAFSGFFRMTTLVLPASVSVVKGGAFYGCSALRTLTFANPGIVTYDRETGEGAFDSSTMPNMVVAARVPDGISTENLRTVKVPDGATAIPFGAFAGCANLSDLTLPDSLTSIAKCAFACCKSLSRVKIPRGVTGIGDGAFAFCLSLSEVALPTKLDRIGSGLFLFCSSLRDVEIPVRVKEIGDYAFFGCAADRFVIPASIEKVGENVFAEYGRAKNVCCAPMEYFGEIPLLVFKGGMPDGFYSMLPDGVSVDELVNTVLPQELLELVLDPEDDPNGFVAGFLEQERCEVYNRLGESGVDVNRLFSSAETYIAHADVGDEAWDEIWAFGYNPYGCSRSLSFEDGNGYFDFVVADDGVEIVGGEFYDEFTVGADGVMSGVCAIPSAVLTLPVVRIGESAFEGSWRDFPEWGVRPRMSIVLPYTLKEVGDFAFADCNWLSDIVIPEGADEIGWGAFAGCTELRNVALPSTLVFVGDGAFAGCTRLRDVEFSSKGMMALGVGAFAECSSLVDVSLYGVDVIGDSAFEGCESLERVMFDAVLASIGVDAFNACFKLQQLVFNGDVPEGLRLAGYPAGARIDYPAQYAENWQGALGADSVSCAIRAPGLLSVTTRIAANVSENAPIAKDVTVLGSEETINRVLDLNVSPRVIDEGSGSVSLEYKEPQLTIVDFKPTEGLILVRVVPEEGCEIVGKVPLERVRLIGYDDLSDMTNGKIVPIQIDDSEYLTQGTQGLLTLRFDATLANFFTASIVDVAVQGE